MKDVYLHLVTPSKSDIQEAFDQAEERIVAECARGVFRHPIVSLTVTTTVNEAIAAELARCEKKHGESYKPITERLASGRGVAAGLVKVEK